MPNDDDDDDAYDRLGTDMDGFVKHCINNIQHLDDKLVVDSWHATCLRSKPLTDTSTG